MFFIEGVAQSQGAIIALFALMVLLLAISGRAQRGTLIRFAGFFALALILLVLARGFKAAGNTHVAAVLRDAGVFIEGGVFVATLALGLFRAVLPRLGTETPTILHDVSVAAALGIWLLAVLRMNDVDVTGLIATSAVLTAVIGLAMQDTLGNLIAGLTLQLDGTVQVGDLVKIDDVVGRVAEARWRYTCVETGDWERVIIPNSLLSKARLVKRGVTRDGATLWRRTVTFNVDFRHSPSHVIEVVTGAVQKVSLPQIAESPAPTVVATDFAESWTRYTLRYWLNDFNLDVITDSEMRAHIHSALQRTGMALSIPAHAVFMTEETEERRAAKAQHETQRRLRALKQVEMFNQLPDDDLEVMATQLVDAPYERGDHITQQGSEPRWLFLLVEGTAERFIEGAGGESVKVAELVAGQVFGDWSLMTSTPRETTVVATSKVRCYRLSKRDFLDAIARYPELHEQMAASVAQYRTQLESAQQHLDEESRTRRTRENQSRVMEAIKRLLRVGT